MSFDYDLCAQFVFSIECNDANRKNLTCTRCVPGIDDLRTASQLEWQKKMNGEWKGPESPTCPDDCCPSYDSVCFQTLGAHGYTINPSEQIMIVHGGLTQRNRTFVTIDGQTKDIYN